MIEIVSSLEPWSRKSTARLASLAQDVGASELTRQRRTQELIRRIAEHPIGRARPFEIAQLAGGCASCSVTGGSAAAGGAAYAPDDEGNAVAGFDMLDQSSFVEAGTVTSITNKVSSVAWTEATNPPAYSATGLSGRPCMDFNGTTHRIISTESAVWGAIDNSDAYTLFIVGSVDVADRTNVFFGGANSAEATNRARRWGSNTTGNGKWICSTTNDAGALVTVESTADDDTNPHVFSWFSPGTTVSLELDNGADDPAAVAQNPGTMTLNRSALGCRAASTPAAFLDGKIGELWLFSVQLGASARTRVHAYLAARWGL